MDAALTTQLQRGCAALGLEPDAARLAALLVYLELLVKWNSAYNLTAVRDPAQMVTRHLLDSLAIAPYLEGQHIIDVGTGPGLPGIPLAILLPERRFALLDSNGKKTRFLFQVQTALGLANIQIHHQRAESFQPPVPYDAVLSRAFASLADMVACCRHLLAPHGRFLAMKGAFPQDEIAAVAPHCDITGVHSLAVPGLAEQRHLVVMTLREGGAG